MKYIIEEFAGTFYEDDLTSLNRLLILYHNRYSFTVRRNDIGDFITSHEQGISKPDWLHWWFGQSKRDRIRQVKRRTAFTLRHNREVIEYLLSREDYGSEKAIYETLTSISNWVQTLSSEAVADKLLDLEGWRKELKILVQQMPKPGTTTKKVSRMRASDSFQEQFTDGDAAERLLKFKRLKRILLTERWIAPIGDSDNYRYCKQSKGGRLYIAALYYVLMEKGYIRMTTDAPQVAASFNSWLIHDFEQSSFVKAFQAEELSQFDGREGNARTKYLTEVRLLLRDL
ncbi:hypothetical protein GCM10007423_08790 [Dyadobacter endophyticus]|uniref:Uncharacterized protein n=1 Tax=Dyadobacter endophyticus TaxID=1749036 RepID=A0ABQ1YHA2_9BACT|nr:hypothetical protein [Dyadobacter endophyticus]GGH24943.1 hypothetical protein GCM10007423_08790 [Dyadobacter endophyticus]